MNYSPDPSHPDYDEFLAGQYVDGVLDDEACGRIETRLQADRDFRVLVDQARRLHALLSDTTPVPESDWEAYERGLSARLGAIATPERPHGLASFRLFAVPAPLRLAIAAAVVLGITTAVALLPGGKTRAPSSDSVVMVVTGPSIESAVAPGVAVISVGPSPQLSRSDSARFGAEDLLSRPSRLVISGSDATPDAGPVDDARIY